MVDVPARLKELGLVLPVAPKPVAAYIPAVIAGNTLYLSGQLPSSNGKLLAMGPVPSVVSLEQAQKAAGQCVLNALAIIGDALEGDWSRLVRIIRLGVFVVSDATFTDQSKVANGASELLGEILGEAGRHVRTTLAVPVLPLGASVEVEILAQIRS